MNDFNYIVKNVGSESLEKFRGKTILITGSNGFLGRWFSDVFRYINKNVLDDSCVIICADNNIVRGDKRDKSIVLNICEEIKIDSLGVDNIDYIINCAGIASPKIYKNYPVETLDVSYLGTKNILDLGRKFNVESILCFSSSEVYGTPDKDNIPTTEEYIGLIPTMSDRSCYDIGKKVLETLCHVNYEKYKSPVKVVRPFNLYGPKMGLHDNRVLPNFIDNIIKGKSLKVYGDGNQTRTFCYVSDAIVTMIKLLLVGKNGEIYNVGNPKPEIGIKDLADEVSNVVKQSVGVEVIDYPDFYPSDEPLRRCPDISKTISSTNYTPQISLQEGLIKMYNYYKEKV
tara:strand:+ start:2278 stop:3303 length:1026 start_codon:yes stop_codon:yes gene_type:complete